MNIIECIAIEVALTKCCFKRQFKLRPHSAKPSESDESKSRLHSRHARKHHTQNTVGESKRVNERDMDSDYLTANFFDNSKRPQPFSSGTLLLGRSLK